MTEYQRIITYKSFKEYQVPNESIYNLIARPLEIKKRSPRYQSRYKPLTKKFYESLKKPRQTMGYANMPLKPPKEYLKKHTRELLLPHPEPKPFTCLDREHKKPPVPKHDDPPPTFHDSAEKNFVKVNKIDVLRKPALKPAKKFVDTPKGDSFFLEFSGLVPKFSMKKEFGLTPKYIIHRRKDLDYSDKMYKESFAEKELIKMTDEEKNDLIEGLRANWEELHHRYVSLPLLIDTKSKKSRKMALEKKLDTLEHDIYFLEKNADNDIYILPG